MKVAKRRVLDVLARRNEEWIGMAMSFKISRDDAMELVQGMYIKMNDYVKDVDKIMYDGDEVNTFYVYVTLKNLYYSTYHLSGNKGRYKSPKLIFTDFSEFNNSDNFKEDYLEAGQVTEAYSKKEFLTSVDFEEENEEIESMKLFDELFGDLEKRIDKITSDWHWYDKRLFDLYHKKNMSMRKISKGTNISLSSVFNTLKTAKSKIRIELQKDYNKYNSSKLK